jgi:hypothetical protein
MSMWRSILAVVSLVGGLALAGIALYLGSGWNIRSLMNLLVSLFLLSPLLLASILLIWFGCKTLGVGELFEPGPTKQPRLLPDDLARHLDTVAAEHIRQLERDAGRRGATFRPWG